MNRQKVIQGTTHNINRTVDG